jgi:IMP cyclohydrolase
MVYRGRSAGTGLTEGGKPAGIYKVEGRSEGSKTRVARYIDDGFVKRVQIGPIGEPTEEQKKKAHLFFYNAMLSIPDIKDKLPYLVVSNGVHTDTIANIRRAFPDNSAALLNALRAFGYEPDSLSTPRIAAELDFLLARPAAILGIITNKQNCSQHYVPNGARGLEKGKFKTISTYSGKDDANPAAPVFEHSIDDIVDEIQLKGETGKELAESLFDSSDSKYIVCAAAAVWTGTGWDIDVKNLHEVKS